MSKSMEIIDITPELLDTILKTFNTENEKATAKKIVDRFVECGFPVKVKLYNQSCMAGNYRILCFIKKSSESVIINNKGMGHDGVSFQIRIDDRRMLEKLSDFNQHIRNQILNSSDCGYCLATCEGKKYVFAYKGKKYIKCRFLCNNFSFKDIQDNDIEEIMHIINNEISCKQSCVK